jgi:amidase
MDWKLEDRLEKRGISRRAFLGTSMLGGAALAVGGGVAGAPASAEGATRPGTQSDVPDFELDEMTVAELQEAMTNGDRTSAEITQLYLERIDALNNKGPRLHAVLETNPDALAIAAALDQERHDHGPRGPLHGIPVLLKDNIATADKMQTTAGSLALVGSKVPRDAFLTARLRAAGAVVLGKANLSEWANFRGAASSSGWSARGGQCNNPYVLDRNPCGSSSGSGAGAAANLAAITVGTETDGSIVCPSHQNGVVGIKPTLGLISRAGIIPISHNQDTAGPICRTVADAATLLGALTGVDPRDPATKASAGHSFTDYTQFLDLNGLQGMRIGINRTFFFGYSPEADAITEEALGIMADNGATIVDHTEIPNIGKYFNSEFAVLLVDFKNDLKKYFAELGSTSIRTLKDCINFNSAHAAQELKFFGQEIMELADSDPVTADEYKQALAADLFFSQKAGLDRVFNRHNLDAIVAPTGSPAWVTDHVHGDLFLGASSWPAAVAGYPSIAVPAGYSHELPVGISLIGTRWNEPKLIKIAFAFEQASHVRHKPKFIPTLGHPAPFDEADAAVTAPSSTGSASLFRRLAGL